MHHCFATSNNRSTCARRLSQRYVFPARMGDPHGPAPTNTVCFKARGGKAGA